MAGNLNLLKKVPFLYANFSQKFLNKLALESKIISKMDNQEIQINQFGII